MDAELPLKAGAYRSALYSNGAFDRCSDYWPLSVPAPPQAPVGKSKRSHTRHRMKRAVWNETVSTVGCVNALYTGRDVGVRFSQQRASETDMFFREVERREA